jgi:hypothetical protein
MEDEEEENASGVHTCVWPGTVIEKQHIW